MKLTIYDTFHYGPGETGPFGNQTGAVADQDVCGVEAGAAVLAEWSGAQDICLGTQPDYRGVTIPRRALLLTPIEPDGGDPLLFAVLEDALPVKLAALAGKGAGK